MTWFRIDDGFYDHPKVDALLEGKHGEAALTLWVLAGTWCARHLTDGVVPAARARKFGVRSAEAAAAELVRVGLWVALPDGFAFHQWTEHQPTREAVTANRERKAKNKRDSRLRSVTGDASTSSPVTDTVTDEHVTGDMSGDAPGDEVARHHVPRARLSRPVPTRPDQIEEDPPAAPAAPSRPSSPEPKSEAPPKPDPEPRIAELSGRYPAELVAAVHAACSRHRKSGVMAGSVWLATLEKLAAYEAGRVVDAMRIFADRYSTGEWDESYLVGIVRNNRGGPAAKSSGWLAPTTQDEYRASAGATDLFGRQVDLGANVTDEDRARVERIGNRRAHG